MYSSQKRTYFIVNSTQKRHLHFTNKHTFDTMYTGGVNSAKRKIFTWENQL